MEQIHVELILLEGTAKVWEVKEYKKEAREKEESRRGQYRSSSTG